MSIGEVARRAGVRPSAIRYYESIGLMPLPGRSSGRRVYDANTIGTLQVIRSARGLGFSVREIRTHIDDSHPAVPITERWRLLARRKLPELEALIGRAAKMKRLLETGLTCDCVRIEDCILYECAPPVVLTRTRALSLSRR
ncbi:MAG: MerR family transcriptional regulator [Gemmatimonadetes bacterium]|nr:MerR family transcriptional regulator [Gemmatimonadota bacterium]